MNYLADFLAEERRDLSDAEFADMEHGLREAWLARLMQITADHDWMSEALGPENVTAGEWEQYVVLVGRWTASLDFKYPVTNQDTIKRLTHLGEVIHMHIMYTLAPECDRYAKLHWAHYQQDDAATLADQE